MRNRKIRLIYASVLLPFLIFGQCTISDIDFEAPTFCNEATSRYAIPVTVTYQNNVETVNLRVTGLHYQFGEKHLKNNHHATSSQNQFTFVIYDYADGQPNDFWVYVDLLGSDCTTITRDSANYTISYAECPVITTGGGGLNPPIPDEPCEETLLLSGSVTEDKGFFAYFNIESTQVFEPGYTDTLGATNNVTLKAGFHAKAGSTLLVNNIGCEPQSNGNGAGSGIVAGNCPSVLYLSSSVSNTRVYSADSLIVVNQELFPTANVTYHAPVIEYGPSFNAQTGATYTSSKTPCSNF